MKKTNNEKKLLFIGRTTFYLLTVFTISLLQTRCNSNPASTTSGDSDSTQKSSADPLPSWNENFTLKNFLVLILFGQIYKTCWNISEKMYTYRRINKREKYQPTWRFNSFRFSQANQDPEY
jgi:hypothetical protein